MKAILTLPSEDRFGNVLWTAPYVYPESHLEEGILALRNRGYYVNLFPEGDGLAFQTSLDKDQMLTDFKIYFAWMEFTVYADWNECNYEEDILKYQIIILPVGRLLTNESIIHPLICLFPPGEFEFGLLNLKHLTGEPFGSASPMAIRDAITEVTEIDLTVFINQAVIVFKKEMSAKQYFELKHWDDIAFIRSCSQHADTLLDIVRFQVGDYNSPEFLPCKPGMWDNSRYSAAMVYFPKDASAYVQAREVELKMFSKSIGMDLTATALFNNHILLNSNVGEVGNIAKHALKLNTLILESDDNTMKFAQIMMLFEYLGNPIEFENFKKLKGKLIACLVNSKTDYHTVASYFRYLSEKIRTEIIHNGKRLDDIVASEEQKNLFDQLGLYIKKLISDLIDNEHLRWEQYEAIRIVKQNQLLN